MKTITQATLIRFIDEVGKKLGVQESIWTPVCQGLVDTSMRGVDSHGIRLLPHYIACAKGGRMNIRPHMEFTQTSYGTGILDADHTFGMVAGKQAMIHAIKLARESGIGAVSVKNSTHFGAAALYGLQAAKEGMLGFAFTNSDSLVMPHGAKQSYFGTNPICFTAPCADEEPICLDMATSVVSFNKILMARENHTELGVGWAADKEGQPTTDANLAKYLYPVGGYKGSGLGMMVEILTSGLTSSPYGPNVPKRTNEDFENPSLISHFFIAIDIRRFTNIESFRHIMDHMNKDMRDLHAQVPGDPEKRDTHRRSTFGIPLTQSDIDMLNQIADEFKMKRLF